MSNITQFSNCQVRINGHWCQVDNLVIFEHQIHLGAIFLPVPHHNLNFSKDLDFYIPGVLDCKGKLRVVNYTNCLYRLNAAIFTKI